ncbi:Cobyrinic acid ac-diamide synthase [Planctopirus limnophila DSM 3776]|uniref:Cobyrinic acid ac-diamide synthase n=1 Tax=Planctopirus limnophila (strain ATCC 43296 / DSM 3776 / IFAM 1008 / Mu 290) TaxID=521674 RepID=D5SV82_PLAL2|nr:MinD/ParA family protein [Planctopirus limnophila]ADG67152.1 Cobyrinic acid ac-diamide synthase [Planctopirus limnophila DSM 3776]
MAKIISTHSFRGGTGKSNTTANLATLIAKAGYRVGVIDTDIQSPGIHVVFQFDQKKAKYALNDYLWGRCSIHDAAYDITEQCIGNVVPGALRPRLYIIPSSLNSGEIARILREGYDVAKLNDGLQELISTLDLDYLLIDTHPGVNEETLLSIAISDVLVLILRPDNQDFQGTAVTVELARRLDIPELLVVVNKVPEGVDENLIIEQVENGYQAEVAVMLPLNNEMSRLGSCGLFTNQYPNHPFTQGLKTLAERIIKSQK